MKFVIEVDVEDRVADAICDEATRELADFVNDLDYDKQRERRSDRAWAALDKAGWLTPRGYVRIEFDTEAGTARVLKRDE